MPTPSVVGSARAIFTITLLSAAVEEVRVDWATKDGSALVGRDYEANSGTVTFAPGETSKTVEVFVHGRTVDTEDRVFYVLLDPPVNALLADEIGACVIHVDTTGTEPVMTIIIPRGEKGLTGDSAYQIALNNGFVGTQPEWLESLRPSPEELAPLVAPLIDAGAMVVTAAGTETLPSPDTTTIEEFAGRIAYMPKARKAIAPPLTAGLNVVPVGAFVGESITPSDANGFGVVCLRAGSLVGMDWAYFPATDEIQIQGALAGDVPIAVQRYVGQGNAGKHVVTVGAETQALDGWLGDLILLDQSQTEQREALIDRLADGVTPGNGSWMIGGPDGPVRDYLSDRVHIRKFGVKADGVTDDSDALESAILAGVPLNWGAGTIRITRALGNQALIPGPIDWKSSGAKVQLDSAITTESVMYFAVLPLNHRIVGKLLLDGASKAFAGIYLRNNSADFFPIGYGTFYASDLQVQNIRRADAVSFFNGDGILIRGGFTTVILDRPVVKNVVMAAGAGIVSVVGVTGISIFGNSDGIGYPRSVVINHPHIENVSSEDAAQKDDMDGIKLFGPAAFTAGTAAIDSTFTINGGVFRNCWGRSIKSQMTTGEVIGSKFIRSAGNNTGIGNEEIAFQQGAGYVKDITCLYYGGNVPGCVVNGGEGTVERKRPSLKVDGIYVANHSSPAIQSIVQTFSPANDAGLISVTNIEVQGPVERIVEYLVDGDGNALSLSNVSVDNLTVELIRVKASGSNSPYLAKVYAERCINTGPLVPVLTHRVAGVAATAELSEYGCTGFWKGGSADTSIANPGSVLRPYAVAGEGQTVGGSLRVQSVAIPAGAVGVIPGHGINGGVCVANLSINRNNASAAVLSISAAGVVSLGAGADVVVGTTTEPITGLFRVWASAGGAINIRNNDSSVRVATLFSMG